MANVNESTQQLEIQTLLTARLYEPRDKSLIDDIEFLKMHPVTLYPKMWKEIKSGRRVVVNKMITTAYCTFLALMHQTETALIGDFKYHHSGIGVGVEAVGNTGLGTPVEDARNIGTQVAAGVTYTSVATTTYTAGYCPAAITEHGLFNDPGAGGPPVTGPTLMDRSVFAAINVITGNQIEWTYVITFVAGG
jgi:hypothetical protein